VIANGDSSDSVDRHAAHEQNTMNLYPLRAELAVMNILGEHRLGAQDSIAQAVVAASWRRYGLREHDLTRALMRLQALGMITAEHKRRRRYIVLSLTGWHWLHSARGTLVRALLLPRLVRSLFKSAASPSANAAMRRRRSDSAELET
jgi:hypothetical protein